MLIPGIILGCVLGGSLLRVFWGWLDSGEIFNPRKFFATVIATLFLALPVASSTIDAPIIIGNGGLLSIAILALLGGWGVNDGVQQLSAMNSTPGVKRSPKNGTPVKPPESPPGGVPHG